MGRSLTGRAGLLAGLLLVTPLLAQTPIPAPAPYPVPQQPAYQGPAVPVDDAPSRPNLDDQLPAGRPPQPAPAPQPPPGYPQYLPPSPPQPALQPTSAFPVPGQPFPGQPMPGQPMPGQPIQGQPMQGQPMPGQLTPGQPIPGQPVSALGAPQQPGAPAQLPAPRPATAEEARAWQQKAREKQKEAEEAARRLASEPRILPGLPGAGLPDAVGVTFPDVLRLAVVSNLDVAQARLAVERARALQLRARSTLLPNVNVGSTYVDHEGQIQNTTGQVITVNRDSLFVGISPTLNLSVSDALFRIPEAARFLDAARAGQTRVTNDTLLAVSDAYFAIVRARRRLARLDETLDFLLSDEERELRGKSRGLLPLITAFVKAGTALPSDQARVEADVVRRQEERITALQDVRTASAELSRLLNLDPSVFLYPTEDFRWPLAVPGDDWADGATEELITFALRARPELAENAALIEAALARYRAAQYRPILPNVVTTYAWGGFGGGPDLKLRNGRTPTLGPSGVIADFGTRADWDISLVWRLQGMGLGNLAEMRETRVRHEQVVVRQMQLQNQVMAQVVQAQEQVQRARERVQVCQSGLFDQSGQPTGAVYRSLKLNFVRIKGGQGMPLEVLDSTRRLSDVLELYGNALTEYDRSRYRLLVALGMPPAALLDPAQLPGCPGKAPRPAPLQTPGGPALPAPGKKGEAEKVGAVGNMAGQAAPGVSGWGQPVVGYQTSATFVAPPAANALPTPAGAQPVLPTNPAARPAPIPAAGAPGYVWPAPAAPPAQPVSAGRPISVYPQPQPTAPAAPQSPAGGPPPTPAQSSWYPVPARGSGPAPVPPNAPIRQAVTGGKL